MTVPAYLDLIDRYLRAAHARAALDARNTNGEFTMVLTEDELHAMLGRL